MSISTLAFFGATGDCAGWALANALHAGHRCIALARTPKKLLDSMQNKGLLSTTLNTHLTIIQGNAKDSSAVKQALVIDGRMVDGIIFGIGPGPKLRFHIFPITLDDPAVCVTAMATILSAVSDLKPAQKPYLVMVSTTGISTGPEDVPFWFRFLYRWLLDLPHQDKRKTEQLLRDEAEKSVSESCLDSMTIVRAAWLLDGESEGLERVRVGVEQKPVLGYTITRKDVGLWIYERLIKGGVPEEWRNGALNITY